MFTNPQDYINYYVDILKKEYKLNDLKVDYHGFVGFLMNLFGWTNFDIKQYYDYLYKEGFLATAEETKNLYLHASKYKYPIDFATPSQAQGNLILDFSKLPVRSANVKKREVIVPEDYVFNIGNFKFSSRTRYRFIEEIKNDGIYYYCVVTPFNSRQRLYSSSSTTVTAPMFNFFQTELSEHTYTIPDYNYGVYNQYSITISEKQQISDVEVLIKKSGTTDFVPYNIKYVKAFETPLSKAVFLNRVSDKVCIIEMGNGYHGEWVPNSVAKVNVWTTYGSSGNTLNKQDGKSIGSLVLNQYDINNNIINNGLLTINSSLFKPSIFSCVNGKDLLLKEDLKNDILNWVETRSNLINKTDFFNLFSRYHKDFNILFKKNQMTDNNFYLLKTLRDQYQEVITTSNYIYSCIRYDDKELIKNKSSDIQYYTDSTLKVGRYYYKIVAIDKFYQSIPSESIIQNVSTIERGIVIKWSPVPNAEYYKVYGRTILYNECWTINTNQLASDGYVYFLDKGQTGTSEICTNLYKIVDQISFPTFDVNLTETINLTDQFYIWKTHILENSYYIDNKPIWTNNITKITYDDIALTYVNTTSELITNSWTVNNRILYLRLDDLFVSENSDIIVEYSRDLNFFSPFIYRYNSFFNWFEGYFIFNNMIQYPINTIVKQLYVPPIYYFNLVYNYNLNQTDIYIRSYQSLDFLDFKIKVVNFDADYVSIPSSKHTIDGFIGSPTHIQVECYQDNVLVFTSITPLFQQVYFIRDQVVLLNYYDENDNKYICNIPIVNYDETDKDFLYTQIYDYIIGSELGQNRMQSDSIQTRFMNTIFCDKSTSKTLLVQQYDHNLILPLNINIKLRYNTSEIDFSSHKNDIELLVAKYLQENATGINIKFYPSQITDLIHDYNASIISVIIDIYDSYGTSLNNGIETIQENEFLFKIKDKLDIVKYNSIYWWWNVDNINIELSL